MARELRNVKIQWEDRVESQLASVAPVWRQGLQFDPTAHKKWFRTRVLGLVERPSNTTATRIEDWVFEIACFGRVKDLGNTNAIWDMVDTAHAAFRKTRVDVLDHAAGGTPKVGELTFLYPKVDEVETDHDAPDLLHFVVTAQAVVVDA